MGVVIGTAGHIDHGKTTLLRALTGIDADRLPEERRRGMTIDVGYAHLVQDDGEVLDFVDVPGHDRLVGNMLVGAAEIDAAMLVVAADDGPRAQTIEHLELLVGLGVRDGIVVVTKTDAADDARVAEVMADARDLVAGTSLGGAEVVAVSATSGTGLPELRASLAALAWRVLARGLPGGSSRLAIDRVFRIKGRGIVVTGTLRGDALSTGALLTVVPGGWTIRIRELQVHGRPVEVAGPGRVAINVAGDDRGVLDRGMVLAADPDTLVASDRWLVALRPTRGGVIPPDRTRAQVHAGTARMGVVVGRAGRDALDLDDDEASAILRLETPLAVAPGDRFVLRRPSPATTLAGGRVLDPIPPRAAARRRSTAERLLRIARADPRDAGWAAARVDLHGAADGRLAPDVAAALDATLVGAVAEAGEIAVARLRVVGAGALRREVRLDRLEAMRLASEALDRLVEAGRLGRDADLVRPAGTGPAALPSELLEAMDRLEAALTTPAPPPLSVAARTAGCSPAGVRELERTHRIVCLDDDLAWAFGTYRQLAATALALAGAGPLTPAAFRDATGTSRKYVMAILEDLDRRAILRRTEAGHVPGPRAAQPALAPDRADVAGRAPA